MTTDERAEAILVSCRERLDRGEAVDVESLVREHPDLAARLRRGFASLARLDRAFRNDDAAEEETPGAALVGRALGPWRLLSVLGSGGMGTVFLAQDGDARAAVKVIHAHLLARRGFFKRFLREAEIGRRVRHENVVATLDADAIDIDDRAVHFLVMEYVEGRTLRALLDESGRLPEALCRHVGREAARALAAIHAAGVVHRDLKPENVIVTADHVVKVMDLGVARLRDDAARLSQTGTFVGSVRYAAPEQFRGGAAAVDARADLYSLGLTLYEASTGAHPFADDDFHVVLRRQLSETPRPAGGVNPQLSPLFEELLAQLLEKDRNLRPGSAEDVARILDEGEESAWWRERSQAIRATTRRPLRRIRIPRETALYGRDAELTALAATFERVRSGEGQVVLVEGEAGIGKSRLVDEYVALLHQQGHDVNFLFGSYPPGGAATVSGAFSTAYREHVGDDEASVRAALPQTPLLVPAFAALLRGDVAPTGAEPLTKDSLQTVFVHATRSFASQRPTIVLIDDLHFAPEEGRALFASLALAVPGHRILLVGAARPGLDEKWLAQIERLEHARRLPLPRLGTKDLVRLLADSLKSAHLAEELAGRIGVKSDGNPFFVFEILRGLREGQFITKRSDGTWATTREIREIVVPSSVVELVQARVSDLGRADRNVLEVASCVGFEFDGGLVGDVLKIDRIPLLQALGAIEKSHRLVRSAGRRFVFDHHQVQEVLYAGLSVTLREAYHAAIGDALEARSGAVARHPGELEGPLCVELAEHFLNGGMGPQALRYLAPALTHLIRVCRNDQAIRLADRALAVPALLGGAERARILLLVARSSGPLDLFARHHERLGYLEKAVAFAREAGDRHTEAWATANLGNVFDSLCRYAEALECHERALALSRGVGDLQGEIVATGNLGSVFRVLGRQSESREHQERALALSREIGYRKGEANATGNLGVLFRTLGRYAQAQELSEKDVAIRNEIGDRHGEAIATGNLGAAFFSLGRYADARAHFQQHVALSREIGDRRGEAVALLNVGLTWLTLGDGRCARTALDASLATCGEIGARYLEGYALGALGAVADSECDSSAAADLIERAVVRFRDIGHREGVADTLVELGELLGRAGDTERACAALEEAVSLSREQGRSQQVALGLALLTCLRGGNAEGAEAALTRAGEVGDSARVRFFLWQATGHRVHLTEAKRRLDYLVAHAPPECRESMLTNVRLHRDIAAAAEAHGL